MKCSTHPWALIKKNGTCPTCDMASWPVWVDPKEERKKLSPKVVSPRTQKGRMRRVPMDFPLGKTHGRYTVSSEPLLVRSKTGKKCWVIRVQCRCGSSRMLQVRYLRRAVKHSKNIGCANHACKAGK